MSAILVGGWKSWECVLVFVFLAGYLRTMGSVWHSSKMALAWVPMWLLGRELCCFAVRTSIILVKVEVVFYLFCQDACCRRRAWLVLTIFSLGQSLLLSMNVSCVMRLLFLFHLCLCHFWVELALGNFPLLFTEGCDPLTNCLPPDPHSEKTPFRSLVEALTLCLQASQGSTLALRVV